MKKREAKRRGEKNPQKIDIIDWNTPMNGAYSTGKMSQIGTFSFNRKLSTSTHNILYTTQQTNHTLETKKVNKN